MLDWEDSIDGAKGFPIGLGEILQISGDCRMLFSITNFWISVDSLDFLFLSILGPQEFNYSCFWTASLFHIDHWCFHFCQSVIPSHLFSRCNLVQGQVWIPITVSDEIINNLEGIDTHMSHSNEKPNHGCTVDCRFRFCWHFGLALKWSISMFCSQKIREKKKK